VVLALGSLTVLACSSTTRHKVLTIFFTGVPEPGAEAVEAQLDPFAEAARKAEENRRALMRVSEFWAHGPFAANECESCHLSDPTVASDEPGSGTARRGGPPPVGLEMTMPEDELCVSCHANQGPELVTERQLLIHMPVEAGLCLECHDPHLSRRRYMLRGPDTLTLCANCHDMEDLQPGTVHGQPDSVECMGCHNPHLGATASMLRADYDERRDPYEEP
jgi:predicted CXXCH cytochrome family protein